MRIVIAKITLLYLSIWVLCGCSTEAMSFSQGFLEGYNEQMREDKRSQYRNKFNNDKEQLIKDIEEKFGIQYVP